MIEFGVGKREIGGEVGRIDLDHRKRLRNLEHRSRRNLRGRRSPSREVCRRRRLASQVGA